MHSGGEQRRGVQIGNVRVRRGRRQRQVVAVERPQMRRPRRPGLSIIFIGLIALIALGTGLLMLPAASREEGSVGFLVALFTATSAACVTGLVVRDTLDTWTPFGQVIIFMLIQIGGLGFMASATLLLLILGRRVSIAQRVVTASLTGSLGGSSVGDLLRRITLMTLAFEVAGAVVLVTIFAIHDDALDLHLIWRGIFTSVSAFNNAGFDLEGGGRSLTAYANSPVVLLTVALLATAGSVGYATIWDVNRTRGWSRLTLNTKVVLSTFAVLILVGMATIFFREAFGDGVLEPLSWPNALVAAFAESAYARTSGFSALDLGSAAPEVLLVIAGLMFIGGASGSTAGGIKVNTFTTLFVTIIAAARGQERVHLFQREIPWPQVNRALTVALLAVAIVFAITIGLTATNPELDPIHVIFEAFSAFGTTGLSAGITGSLNAAGQVIIILGMFVGRVGPLAIALVLAGRFSGRERIRYPESEINIG
ncbi:MAG: Trk family potassium uptake protein [Chloroflexi bacterium]|nr:Trk family potassium uptake protein [Chloroflexota bacterium]